ARFRASDLRGYIEIAARKDFVAGMHAWSFADFAVVQGTRRVGGLSLKGGTHADSAAKMSGACPA
ncbi:MAG: hypothetical protein ACRDIE_07075, partial [Chloroflexota bacterium]